MYICIMVKTDEYCVVILFELVQWLVGFINIIAFDLLLVFITLSMYNIYDDILSVCSAQNDTQSVYKVL